MAITKGGLASMLGSNAEAIALYRISLGIMLFIELVSRFQYLHPFYSDEGRVYFLSISFVDVCVLSAIIRLTFIPLITLSSSNLKGHSHSNFSYPKQTLSTRRYAFIATLAQ